MVLHPTRASGEGQAVLEYTRLRRRVFRAEQLTETEIALIAKVEVPAEHAHLDAELAGDGRIEEASFVEAHHGGDLEASAGRA